MTYSDEGYLGCRWEREVRDTYFYCAAGIEVGGLLADGSYGACPSLAREWVQGNVWELPFSEAWETRYKNMRDRRWMRAGPCGSCAEWKFCRGSSLHLWDWPGKRPAICHFELLKGVDIEY
ncbi:MAG: hypothetical protein K6U03_01085 [Firmicutes bacterium]|nr:hypothetical protein [Bacillota bacterium]